LTIRHYYANVLVISKIKQKIMAFKILQKPLQLQPIAIEETDELTEAIKSDPLGDGDSWDLHQDIDANRLNEFLDAALEDAHVVDSTNNQS